MLNPSYSPLGNGTAAFFEGCLSALRAAGCGGASGKRAGWSIVTPDGEPVSQDFSGWQARIVQHETDHLHGTLYIDRAELRSLSTNSEYAARWAEPGIGSASRELGFPAGAQAGREAEADQAEAV